MILRCLRRSIPLKQFNHCAKLHSWKRLDPTTLITTNYFTINNDTLSTPNSSTLISIDSSARIKLHSLFTRFPDKFLRISVDGGGCHGYQYVYKLDNKFDQKEDIGLITAPELQLSSLENIEEDNISYTTLTPSINVTPVVVDKISLNLLLNSKLTYQQDMMGEQFVITDNPIAETGCGCGISFGIKESI